MKITKRKQKMYLKRLLKLADFLEGLPRKRFYYGWWVGRDWKGDPNLSCGTTACALGWATTMPAFRRLGLRMIRRSRRPRIGRLSTRETAAYLFGPDAEHLFFPYEYDPVLECATPDSEATPKQVAGFIRRHVKAVEKQLREGVNR